MTLPPAPQPKHLKICRCGLTVKEGGPLLMKGADRLPHRAGSLQREIAADYIHHIIGGDDLFDGFGWDERHAL
jgi:hypothetical protein